MLFTSNLRKAVDTYPVKPTAALNQTAEETHRLLLEKRRKQMIRRHTCSTLIKAQPITSAISAQLPPPPPPPPLPPPPSAPLFSTKVAILEEDEEELLEEKEDVKKRKKRVTMAPPAPPPASFDSWNSVEAYNPTPFSTTTTTTTTSSSSHQNQVSHQPVVSSYGSTSSSAYQPFQNQNQHHQNNDDFDDEWTDEDEEQQEPSRNSAISSGYNSNSRRDLSRSQSEHGSDRGSHKVNKNINRFSNFVKSGMEAYVIGETRATSSPPSEKHEIVMLNGRIQWKPIQQYYYCTVDKPKKESKLKGLKSFIAYSITSSLTNIQVSRRYKHFDWLYEQLSTKYVLIPIPPLPEKQVSGRYEDDLIDHRKHILQLWVNKICRHPVLSMSETWLHFISCTDEKDWKMGKRRAEKDEYVGGQFMNCVTLPAQGLDPGAVEHAVETFQRSVKTSEEAMRAMQDRMLIFQKAFAGPVKQNWQKMGSAFKTLQQSFEIDETPASKQLTKALTYTSTEYHEIGQLFDAHTKKDMEPVLENLYSFKGTVQNVPDILNMHKQAIQKFRESEGRLPAVEAEKMRQRIDAISFSVLAEINHQTQEKVADLKSTMGTYLKRQAEFYQDVANKLSSLSTHYESP